MNTDDHRTKFEISNIDVMPGLKENSKVMKMRVSLRMGDAVSDSRYCEAQFCHDFITDAMALDFPGIANIFLTRGMIPRDDPTEDLNVIAWHRDTPVHALRQRILGAMIHSAREGNAAAAEMLCAMYRTYYKKEYRQLKRFRSLNVDDVMALVGDAKELHVSVARIFYMARLLGIPTDESCRFLYALVNSPDKIADETDTARMLLPELSGTIYTKARRHIKQLLLDSCAESYKSPALKGFRLAEGFVQLALRYHGYHSGFCHLGDPNQFNPKKFITTQAILSQYYPDEMFSFDDIQHFAVIFNIIEIFCEQLEALNDEVERILGISPAEYDEDYPRPMFRTELLKETANAYGTNASSHVSAPVAETRQQTQGGSPATSAGSQQLPRLSATSTEAGCQPFLAHAVPNADGVPITSTSADDNGKLRAAIDSLQKELDELKCKYKKKSQDYDQLGARYADARKEINGLTQRQKQYEGEHDELAALRQHIYQYTESDLPISKIPTEIMEQAISGLRIVIIGGHSNWTNKLRSLFPGWTFIKPGATQAAAGRILEHADHVYFFTDCIRHCTYLRYIKAVRDSRLRFGYIHSIHIPANIWQIYNDCINS